MVEECEKFGIEPVSALLREFSYANIILGLVPEKLVWRLLLHDANSANTIDAKWLASLKASSKAPEVMTKAILMNPSLKS